MGLRLIEKIAGIYDSLPLRSFTVKEWGNEKIFFKPVTGEEYDAVNNLLPEKATGPHNNAQVVISKALDENGARVFKDEDIETLLKKGFIETTGNISSAMMKVVDPEAAEGN